MQRITSDHGVLHYSKVLFLRHISSLIKGTFCGYYSGHFSRKMLVLFKDSKVQCIISKKPVLPTMNISCQNEDSFNWGILFFSGQEKISMSYFGLLMLEEILNLKDQQQSYSGNLSSFLLLSAIKQNHQIFPTKL